MERESTFEPRLVAWFTGLSHEWIYQILKGKMPNIMTSAKLVEFMNMVEEIRKVWEPLVKEWEGESFQVIDAGLHKLKGHMPAEMSLEKFADIILSDHPVSKKIQLLTNALLRGKKKCEERPSHKELKESFEAFKEMK
ncbi:hypothetical protein ES703_70273 [subsurface metagenome]